jgi:two-component system sensor histidine kinase PhoQ
MRRILRHILPLSAGSFLLATAAVVLVLSLSYGMVALVGYSVSFDKTTFRLLRGESNLFYTLAKWENNRITVEMPENLNQQSPTLALIYNEKGNYCGRSVISLAGQKHSSGLAQNQRVS